VEFVLLAVTISYVSFNNLEEASLLPILDLLKILGDFCSIGTYFRSFFNSLRTTIYRYSLFLIDISLSLTTSSENFYSMYTIVTSEWIFNKSSMFSTICSLLNLLRMNWTSALLNYYWGYSNMFVFSNKCPSFPFPLTS